MFRLSRTTKTFLHGLLLVVACLAGLIADNAESIVSGQKQDRVASPFCTDFTDQMLPTPLGIKGGLVGAAFSPDSKTIATTEFRRKKNGRVSLVNLFNQEMLWNNTVLNYSYGPILFSPDGKMLAVAVYHEDKNDERIGGRIAILRADSGKLLRTIDAHKYMPDRLLFSKNGEVLISTRHDEVKLWSVSDGKLLHTLVHHTRPSKSIVSMMQTPDGSHLVVANGNGDTQVWHIGDGELVNTLKSYSAKLLTDDGGALVGTTQDGKALIIRRMSDGALLRTLLGHSSFVRGLVLTPDGEILISGSSDGTIKFWEFISGKLLRTVQGSSKHIEKLAITPDGKILISTSNDNTIRLWKVINGDLIHSNVVFSDKDYGREIELAPDGKNIACVYNDDDKDLDLLPTSPANKFIEQLQVAQRMPPLLIPETTVELKESSGSVTITCSNKRGRGSLYNVWARLQVKKLGLDKFLWFAHIEAGKEVTLNIPFSMPRTTEGERFIGTVEWHEHFDEAPSEFTKFKIGLDDTPRPQLSYSVRILDDVELGGNGDGRLQANEIVDLKITIVNLGSKEAKDITAKVESNSARLYGETTLNFGNLKPKESATRKVSVKVKLATSKSVNISLIATETSFNVGINETMSFPVAQKPKAAVISIDTEYWINVGATVYSGASSDSDIIGRVESSFKCKATGKLDIWYRFELKSGELCWVKEKHITQKMPEDVIDQDDADNTDGIVRVFQKQPPMIVMLSPSRKVIQTTLESIEFSGAIADDTGIKSVIVKVNDKVILKSKEKGLVGVGDSKAVVKKNQANASAGRMPFTFKLPLSLGLNRVEIKATDTDDQSARVYYEITRESVKGRVLVMCVGIKDYNDDKISDLGTTELDAQAMYDFYTSDPRSPAKAEDCKLLLGKDATAQNIKATLQEHLLNQADPEDTVIFYFSGHGFADGDTFYMIPQDTRSTALAATAIALGEFQRLWSKIAAERRIFITDACNSGGFTGLRDADGVAARGYTALGKGSAVLTASSGSETALDGGTLGHGVYTYYLLKALKGEKDESGKIADTDNNGKVSIEEIHSFCKRNVPAKARRLVPGHKQTPSAKIDISGEVSMTK